MFLYFEAAAVRYLVLAAAGCSKGFPMLSPRTIEADGLTVALRIAVETSPRLKREIALDAGITPTSLSRFLNGKHSLYLRTADRVYRAATGPSGSFPADMRIAGQRSPNLFTHS